jgi:hypothetical protein
MIEIEVKVRETQCASEIVGILEAPNKGMPLMETLAE